MLRLWASHLAGIPGCLAIRDGGDEFIVIGAPTRPFLADDIDAARTSWPDSFRERFGPDMPMVSPRFILDAGTGRTTDRCENGSAGRSAR